MLISIIIPAYNASNSITYCLNSVFQTFSSDNDCEVIVIDDCSTDNTVPVVKGFQNNHSNLFLYCQAQNHRQGAARNIGMNKAKGDYVVFLDSDDEMVVGVLQAVKIALEKDLEIIAMRVSKVSEDGCVKQEFILPYHDRFLFSGVELQTSHPFWFTGPIAYIYKKAFLEEVNYPFAEDVLYEDCDFVNVHLYHAKRMAYCDECGYRVHYNPESTTHTISYKHLADYALLGTRMLSFYNSLPDKTTEYADSILEGGSFNIMKAFRRLPRLKSAAEVRAFYDRFDAHYNRRLLLGYCEPAYCWTLWTRFGLKHRNLTIAITGVAILFLALIRAK